MTTCYNDNVLFIHIPKCGGSSVGGLFTHKVWQAGWLSLVCDNMSREGFPHGHIAVRHVEEFTGRPLDSFKLILATIRNPFAQQVSQYEFWRAKGLESIAHGKPVYECHQLALDVDFETFVDHDWSVGSFFLATMEEWPRYGGAYRCWLADKNYQLPTNLKVVRIEDADEQLPGIVEPIADALPCDFPPIPHENAADEVERDWRAYLTPNVIRTVQRKFAWSLTVFYPDLINQAWECLTSTTKT